jgi:hypothetical protein
MKWEKVNSFTFKQSSPQIAFDEENDIVFIVLRNNIYTYSLQDNKFDSIPVNNRGRPYHGISRQLIYNPENKKLYSKVTGLRNFDRKYLFLRYENFPVINRNSKLGTLPA